MNAPVDRANVQATALSSGSVPDSAAALQPNPGTVTPLRRETAPAPDDKICWIEVHQAPYPPDQQVELLHLQAEAEALLLQLQARHQRRQNVTTAEETSPV